MNGLMILLTSASVAEITNNVTSSVMSKITGVGFQILMIVGFWILFESKNERGWKAIIPIYSTYISYKLFYKKSRFWILFVFTVIFFISVTILAVVGLIGMGGDISDAMGISGIIAWGFFVISVIAIIVISIGFDISICKKYNMGLFFTLGMIFFTPIFTCVLAYEVRAGRAIEIE